MPLIEGTWGVKVAGPPLFEIVPADKFLGEVQGLQADDAKRVGYGAVSQAPLTIYLSPIQGRIIIPEQFVGRIVKGDYSTSTARPDFEPVVTHWNKLFLEQVVSQALSNCIFRQQRGEWKEGFVKAMQAIDTAAAKRISDINKLVAIYINEQIAGSERPEWALHVASDKLNLAWHDRRMMDVYRAIDYLAWERSIRQAVMVDNFLLYPGRKIELYPWFESTHPYYAKKEQLFDQAEQQTAGSAVR